MAVSKMGTDRADRAIALAEHPRPGAQPCKIMLDLSPSAIRDRASRFNFEPWQLRTPLTRNALAGVPYGLDNGCFGGSLPPAWYRLIDEARASRPLWATSPDVVGSARRTMELWPRFARAMMNVPRALVLQDGIGEFAIPWDEVACVFVGGTDAFKSSGEARAAVTAARLLGKWVHVGRVNTAERAAYWKDLADSVDGSGISRYDHMLSAVLAGLSGISAQHTLDL